MSDWRTLPTGIWQQTLVVNKSRFVAFASQVADSEQARAFLQQVALPDATHHCYAYITADSQKSSDNGEPSGTAGLPILQAIQQQHLCNVVVAVERYFGGVKLGTGGLARAYGQAAKQVLTSVAPIWMRECCVIKFETNYGQQTVVTNLIEKYGKVLNIQYQDVIKWQVAILRANQKKFNIQLTESLHGEPRSVFSQEPTWIEFPDCEN